MCQSGHSGWLSTRGGVVLLYGGEVFVNRQSFTTVNNGGGCKEVGQVVVVCGGNACREGGG